MPKALSEIKKFENSIEIKQKILQILDSSKGKAFLLEELEHFLIKDSNLGINLGGKLFLYGILKDLMSQKIINSIISNGKQYFFIGE